MEHFLNTEINIKLASTTLQSEIKAIENEGSNYLSMPLNKMLKVDHDN